MAAAVAVADPIQGPVMKGQRSRMPPVGTPASDSVPAPRAGFSGVDGRPLRQTNTAVPWFELFTPEAVLQAARTVDVPVSVAESPVSEAGGVQQAALRDISTNPFR